MPSTLLCSRPQAQPNSFGDFTLDKATVLATGRLEPEVYQIANDHHHGVSEQHGGKTFCFRFKVTDFPNKTGQEIASLEQTYEASLTEALARNTDAVFGMHHC
jgi:hypothetical protein